MTNKPVKLTKATKVHEWLRDDIISGRLAPGEKLQMETLRQRYGVGYSPLREALSRLANNGLVQLKEQCGFYVAPLSITELQDLYKMRTHIEIMALEQAIERGDDHWEAHIVACWHRFAKYLDPETTHQVELKEWETLQKEFLLSLVQGCGSPWLLRIRTLLYDQGARYRALCIHNHSKNKKLRFQYLKENETLVNAVLARNTTKAVSIYKKSWENTLKSITQILQDKLTLQD